VLVYRFLPAFGVGDEPSVAALYEKDGDRVVVGGCAFGMLVPDRYEDESGGPSFVGHGEAL
jgi:hypothetical protein